MKFLHTMIEKVRPSFENGRSLEKFYPIFEATETFLFSTAEKTETWPHIRDSIDIKRVMILVVVALLPCYIFGAINIGIQSGLAHGVERTSFQNFIFGMGVILPIIAVTFITGGFWEILFAVTRKHDIYEGFLVTCTLIPLVMPPTIPLWQVSLATT
ncbi:MAG: RnfABCDGE type electron transport complex subunit D, partial [Candidatus Marinimicrobia bacterium]|nr:RnfABCDGE type electron transport complex subunit D [Candidatus Neomarinimicrobiota bacterium]